jgi:hypothetical protein
VIIVILLNAHVPTNKKPALRVKNQSELVLLDPTSLPTLVVGEISPYPIEVMMMVAYS